MKEIKQPCFVRFLVVSHSQGTERPGTQHLSGSRVKSMLYAKNEYPHWPVSHPILLRNRVIAASTIGALCPMKVKRDILYRIDKYSQYRAVVYNKIVYKYIVYIYT